MAGEADLARADYEAATEMVQKARDTFMAVEEVVNSKLKEFLVDLRSVRMAIGSELRATISDMQQIREFALSNEHSIQVQRIRELCDLCERIRVLHESGLLNAVTDTIVKLMEPNDGSQGR